MLEKIRKVKEVARVFGEMRHILPALNFKMPAHKDTLSVGGAFEDTVAAHPERTMLLFEGREWTYSEFNQWINRFARVLQARGVQRGDTVALFMENRAEFILSLLATLKVGASCALINNSLSGAGLVHCVQAARATHVIVGDERASVIDACRETLALNEFGSYLWFSDADTSTCPDWCLDAKAEMVDHGVENIPITREITAGEVALYIYTSGTTGLPKAAIMLHRKALAASTVLGRLGFRVKPTDRLYLCLPIYHTTGLGPGLLAFILSGGSVFLRRQFSASNFWSEVKQFKTNSFIYVGELCRYLNQQPEHPQEKNNPLEKMLGNGLRPDVWDAFKSRFAVERICEIYGSSEGNVTFANFFNKNRTIGATFAKVALVAYDQENSEIIRNDEGHCIEVTAGTPGLLLGEITADYAFDGYTNKDATGKKIIHDVLKPGDQWFDTGDLIREIDVGFAFGIRHFQFVDRTGDTFRWRSENVSTNEVAEVLNQHLQIHLSNVYGVEVPGVEGRAGMAALSVDSPDNFDLAGFARLVDAQLPGYARPVFIRLQLSLETTGTFKLLKTELREQSFHLDQVGEDPVYVRLPNTETYQRLDSTLYQSLCLGTAGY
ncbi:MAG: long-chain-acyl-CoA synthetase [Luminiphilus sp.]|nr:long-chain-acyl-CoA synthetase [Luminiphilus sp.]